MPEIVGKIILQRYRVESYIASGGMSAVYRVWDMERNAHLAMKVLLADLAEDPVILQRFRREARALRKLSHPNIVPFYGIEQFGEQVFLLEKYVDGLSLKDVIRQNRSGIPASEALIYFKALCAALGYAHKNGVVHCDVKPGNVMVDRTGNIFLTDFGVARHAESTTTTLGMAGTVSYMAPEQITGNPVTAETDVYALGIVLYEMLTGRRPFTGHEGGSDGSGSGATAAERVRTAQLVYAPPNPLELNPHIPAGLASVVMMALMKDYRDRYCSMEEFLDAACAAMGLTQMQIPDRVIPPFVEDLPPSPPDIVLPPRRKLSWLWAVAGGTLMILLASGVLVLSGIGGLFYEPTATIPPTPEQKVGSLGSPLPTIPRLPSPTLVMLPTYTLPPTYTPVPTYTSPALPTRTTRPTDPPIAPTYTPLQYVFHIENGSSSAIYVYVDGKALGQVAPGQRVWAIVDRWGTHTIRFCHKFDPVKGKWSGCQNMEVTVNSYSDVITVR